MRKVYIKAQNCKTGMTLIENLCTNTGACLIPKGTYITEDLEKKIRRFRLMPIRVEVDESVEVEYLDEFEVVVDKREMSEELTKVYSEAKKEAKSIIDDLSSGNKLETARVDKAIETIQENVKDSFDVLNCISSIRSIDEYTYAHCVNVSLLAMTLARWVGFSEEEAQDVAKAGLLHDIGKTKLASDLYNKESNLTPEEFEEVKKHSTYGYRMVENIPNMTKDIKMGILMHHEREDGTGYPLGAKEAQIHRYAKILAIADVYDAMTSDKTYRKKKSIFEVLKEMNGTMYNHFDFKYFKIFTERIVSHYIGDHVVLSTGETGQIVHINIKDILRPIVKVSGVYVDLSKERDVEIQDLLWDYSVYEVV